MSLLLSNKRKYINEKTYYSRSLVSLPAIIEQGKLDALQLQCILRTLDQKILIARRQSYEIRRKTAQTDAQSAMIFGVRLCVYQCLCADAGYRKHISAKILIALYEIYQLLYADIPFGLIRVDMHIHWTPGKIRPKIWLCDRLYRCSGTV